MFTLDVKQQCNNNNYNVTWFFVRVWSSILSDILFKVRYLLYIESKPSGHMASKWRRSDIDVTSLCRIDVSTTSLQRHVLLGHDGSHVPKLVIGIHYAAKRDVCILAQSSEMRPYAESVNK